MRVCKDAMMMQMQWHRCRADERPDGESFVADLSVYWVHMTRRREMRGTKRGRECPSTAKSRTEKERRKVRKCEGLNKQAIII